MNKITIFFRCGHTERLKEKEINFPCGEIFEINGKKRAESGNYCLFCSQKSLLTKQDK